MKTKLVTRYFTLRLTFYTEDVPLSQRIREPCRWNEGGQREKHECQEPNPEAALEAFINKIGRQAIVCVFMTFDGMGVTYERPAEQ